MSATTGANPYQAPESNVAPSGFGTASQLAGRGNRFAAKILDNLFLMAFMLPGVFVMLLGAEEGQAAGFATGMEGLMGLGGILMFAGLIVWAVINYRLVADNGWTLGKRVCSVRTVRSDGSAVTVGRVFFLRFLIISLLGAIPILGALISIADPLFIFGEGRRCLHDRIADTIVVQA